MNTGSIIDEVLKLAELSESYAEEGDYYGPDGLLYCGKCNTPRQGIAEIDIPEMGKRKFLHSCLCKCRIEVRDAELAKAADAEREAETSRRRAVGFPDAQLRRWTFAADDGSNAWLSMVAHKYVEKFEQLKKEGKGLLMYGPVGTGKTFMSACIANALIDKGYSCLVTNFSRIVSSLEEVKFNGQQKYLDKLNENSLIVIDDLGAERNTEYMAEKVFDIVDARSRSGKPLIVTTNLTGEEIKNAADIRKQRIYSRLLEMCYMVNVKGTDRRRAKASNVRSMKS